MSILQIFNPWNRSLIAEIPYTSEKEIENIFEKAVSLSKSSIQRLSKVKRIEVLENLIRLMNGLREDLITTAIKEGGKPYPDTKVEIERAIQGVKIAIREIYSQTGQEIPMGITPSSENRHAFTIREPIGVVLAYSAFNHPLNLIVHQVVPAIAAGCPVIIKPAPVTPLSCVNFVKLLADAGLPEGWCQVIIGDNSTAGKIVSDTRINYFNFIGSANVGWHLRSLLPPGARCTLEHGGAAPVIVCEDANINDMIPLITKGGYYHAGQVCVSVQRVFVPEKLLDKISHEISTLADKMKVGDPSDEHTSIGPLIRTTEVTRLEEWMKDAETSGGKIVAGGKRFSDTSFLPTLIVNPSPDAFVSKHEIFGPVICLYSYKNIDTAIFRANNLSYNFQSAVFTSDINKAFYCIRHLKGSAVMVNDSTTFRTDWMPFGGHDYSGIGTGGIPYTIREMSKEKLVVWRSELI